MKTVGVIGGGIAGLTVADELSMRGYEVHVFESDPAALGGKAKSHGFRAENGWKDLPAEHGFRFFPGFYTNVIRTMSRIRHPSGRTVADRLVNAHQLRYSFSGPTTGCVVHPLDFKSLAESVAEGFWKLFERDAGVKKAKLFEASDAAYLASLFHYVKTSSVNERLEMEGSAFSTFTVDTFPTKKEAHKCKPSATLQHFLTNAGTRMLVAAQPERMSARTGLVTVVRMLDPSVMVEGEVDRLLAGPTSPEWFDPWVVALRSPSGGRVPVTFHMGRTVTELTLVGEKVTAFATAPGNTAHHYDHVVLAVPHGVVQSLLAPHQASLPAPLQHLDELTSDWMCGVQYYLSYAPDVCGGHVMYVDSPWALTSVTQAQFWRDFNWSAAGDGSVKDVLSVCVSNWDAPGLLHKKPAKECTEQEIREEVWHQMVTSLNDVGEVVLPVDQDDIVRAFHLDPGVTRDGAKKVTGNATPLYVNTKGSWHDRPPVDPGMDNLFLAGDWVRTNADLATMEAASEAGLRAANAILHRDCVAGDVTVTSPDALGLL